MKAGVRLVLAYLAASLLMAVLSVMLHPPHAHVPVAALLLAFPLFPVLACRDVLMGDARAADFLSMGVFVLAFGGIAWHALRGRP